MIINTYTTEICRGFRLVPVLKCWALYFILPMLIVPILVTIICSTISGSLNKNNSKINQNAIGLLWVLGLIFVAGGFILSFWASYGNENSFKWFTGYMVTSCILFSFFIAFTCFTKEKITEDMLIIPFVVMAIMAFIVFVKSIKMYGWEYEVLGYSEDFWSLNFYDENPEGNFIVLTRYESTYLTIENRKLIEYYTERSYPSGYQQTTTETFTYNENGLKKFKLNFGVTKLPEHQD